MINLIGCYFILLVNFSFNYADWKVINGTNAAKCQYPEMVSVEISGKPVCGGTLLNRNTVLTAAHCVYDIKDFNRQALREFEAKIVVGKYNLHSREKCEMSFMITKVILHFTFKDCKLPFTGFDIAIVKFDGNVSDLMCDCIKYVKIDANYHELLGDRCEIVGWGNTHPVKNVQKNILQKATVKIINSRICANAFTLRNLQSFYICIGSAPSRSAACIGDSGGPLFCKNQFNENIQVGIVSYSFYPCGKPYAPTVFSRVNSALNWINCYS